MSADQAPRPAPAVGPRQLLLFLRECFLEIRKCARSSNPEDLAQIEEHARDGLRALDRLDT